MEPDAQRPGDAANPVNLSQDRGRLPKFNWKPRPPGLPPAPSGDLGLKLREAGRAELRSAHDTRTMHAAPSTRHARLPKQHG